MASAVLRRSGSYRGRRSWCAAARGALFSAPSEEIATVGVPPRPAVALVPTFVAAPAADVLLQEIAREFRARSNMVG